MSNQGNEMISIAEFVEIVRRRKMWLGVSVILALVLVMLYNHLAMQLYEASASVVFENYSKNTIVDFEVTKTFSWASFVANRIQEMKTKAFARQIYEELSEAEHRLFRFPDPLPPQFDGEKYIIDEISENLSVRQIYETDVVAITFASESAELAATVANTAAKVLQTTNLNVRRQEYANLGNFIGDQLEVVSEKLKHAEEALSEYKTRKKITAIDDESREILQRITQAEVLLNRVKADRDAMRRKLMTIKKRLNEQKRDLTSSVVQITDPLTAKLKENLVELNVRYSSLQAQGQPDDHPKMVELRREIEKIKQELVRTTKQILEGEAFKGVLDPLSELKKNLEESTLLEVEEQSLTAQNANLQETLKRYLERLEEIPGQELELVRLMRDREINNKIYVRLLEEREQARIREAAEIGNIRVIELAKTPRMPSRPRKMLNLIIGFFAGSVFGLVLIFAREFMRDAPQTQEEVEQLLNLPVLASVPQIKPRLSISLNGHAKRRMLINHETAVPMLGDAFSYLWNSVELALPCSGAVVMVTSARAAEGKSTVATNLCLIAAQQGKRTILIDGDTRRPTIHKILGLSASPGLTNIVAREIMYSFLEPSGYESAVGLNEHEAQVSSVTTPESKLEVIPWAWAMQASIRQALQQHPAVDRLKILAAGDAFIKPHRLWGTPIIKEIMSLLKQAADLIVIDSPPVIGIPDSSFIARYADQILLCVEATKTDKKVLQRALKVLDHTQAKVLGVVLNMVDPAVLYGGFKYYKYYERYYNKPGAVKKRFRQERYDVGGNS
jgi:uncharacterized protein involved in exopolysaccharide biosynthesis/MinD-like ATPase involved in chromosome partitioning or flagellar assembly